MHNSAVTPRIFLGTVKNTVSKNNNAEIIINYTGQEFNSIIKYHCIYSHKIFMKFLKFPVMNFINRQTQFYVLCSLYVFYKKNSTVWILPLTWEKCNKFWKNVLFSLIQIMVLKLQKYCGIYGDRPESWWKNQYLKPVSNSILEAGVTRTEFEPPVLTWKWQTPRTIVVKEKITDLFPVTFCIRLCDYRSDCFYLLERKLKAVFFT